MLLAEPGPASLAHAEAAVFDMDGTLVDSEAIYRALFFEAAEETGVIMPPGLYERMVGLATPDRAALLRTALGPGSPIDALLAAYRARKRRRIAAGLPLGDGAAALLAALRAAGIACALATAATRRTAEAVMGAHLAGFDAVVTREDVKRGKPDAATHLRAAALLRRAPGRCLAVEDSTPGLLGAVAAGMITVAITDGPAPPHAAVFCSAVIGSLRHLPALLPQWQLRIQ